MSGSFSFSFRGEDIEHDEEEMHKFKTSANRTSDSRALLPARLHTLEEMLANLPSSISYRRNDVSGSVSPGSYTDLPRRELFDMRAQIMAEAELGSAEEAVIEDVSSDIVPRVYEGGFKTWECSLDLARYLEKNLLQTELRRDQYAVHVIELGAGTAVPTSTMLANMVESLTSLSVPVSAHFTVADYNEQVLQLATVPNLLLAALWKSALGSGSSGGNIFPLPSPPARLSDPNPSSSLPTDGDLDTTSPDVEEFAARLRRHNIQIRAISGGWGDGFVQLARTRALEAVEKPTFTLVLASETIYAPDTLPAFVSTLIGLLSPENYSTGTGSVAYALVAAKKVYFGVGGGVDEFVEATTRAGAVVRKVWDSDDGNGNGNGGSRKGGVGRCILRMAMA